MSPYELLGLRTDATDAQVRAAYRRAARATHPDHGGDPDVFAAVEQAYRTLTGRALHRDDGRDDGRDDERAGGDTAAELPPPAPGPWRQSFDWPLVQRGALVVLAALRLAGTGGVVAAVIGLWAAVVALPFAVAVWMLCAAVAALRPTAPGRRGTRAAVRRRLRLSQVAAGVAALPLAVLVCVVSGWTLARLVQLVATVVLWALR